jgi:hypothetical protein
VHTDLLQDQSALSAARRAARRTPWMPLLSALLELGGGKGELVRHSERNWASVTFAGTRHSVVIAFTGAEAVTAGEAFIDALPDHEFTIPRQLVADAAVVAVEHTTLPEQRLEVTAELLLLEDA